MIQTLRLYWDILRFRRGPEDLPVSLSLLFGTVAARLIIGVLVFENTPDAGEHNTALLLLDAAVLLLWGRMLLQIAGRPERYLQTMTAVFGCELVLQPLQAPATWFYGMHAADPNLGAVALLLVYAIGVWALIVFVRILRAATGWPVLGCVAAAFGQEMLTLLIGVMLFPDLIPKVE